MKKYVIAIALTLMAVLAYLYLSTRGGYVAVIDGEKISPAEYAVYLVQMKERFEGVGGADIWETAFGAESAEDVAKQNALNRVIFIKTSVRQAKKMGLILSKEELSIAHKSAEEFFLRLDKAVISRNGITQELVALIMEEAALEQVVFDEVVKNYTPGAAEIDKYIQQNLPDVTDEVVKSQIKNDLREQYITEKKEEMFLKEYTRWAEDIRITKNQEVWDTIFIGDY